MDIKSKLQNLISEACVIKAGIRIKPSPGVIRAFPVYELEDTSQYYEWKHSTERLLFSSKDVLAIDSFKDLINKFEKVYSPGHLGDIIGMLRSFQDSLEQENEIDRAETRRKTLSNKVFIVHGHNNELIAETKDFLRQLGLEPIVLRDQISKGQTIIEKIESYSDVDFAIVLYTKCDRGGLNTETSELKPRARQNVVFEHGCLCAKLGRNNVTPLVEEGVEYPGDLSGIVYIGIDKAGAWKTSVAKEMKAAGLVVDLNRL